MQRALKHLLELARKTRDDRSLRAQDATRIVAQAHATQTQLEAFRSDMVMRSPGAQGQPVPAQALADRQRFVLRLDEAVLLQGQQVAIRREQEAVARSTLHQAQQRLLALQALEQRQQAALDLRERRQQQRESDEHAARSFRAGQREAHRYTQDSREQR